MRRKRACRSFDWPTGRSRELCAAQNRNRMSRLFDLDLIRFGAEFCFKSNAIVNITRKGLRMEKKSWLLALSVLVTASAGAQQSNIQCVAGSGGELQATAAWRYAIGEERADEVCRNFAAQIVSEAKSKSKTHATSLPAGSFASAASAGDNRKSEQLASAADGPRTSAKSLPAVPAPVLAPASTPSSASAPLHPSAPAPSGAVVAPPAVIETPAAPHTSAAPVVSVAVQSPAVVAPPVERIPAASPAPVATAPLALTLNEGEPIHTELERWATSGGWKKFSWTLPYSWRVFSNTTFSGKTALEAISMVIENLRDEGKPVRMNVFEGNGVLEVVSGELAN